MSASPQGLFPASFEPRTITLPSTDTTKFFLLHHKASSQSQSTSPKILLLLHGYPQNHTLWHAFIQTAASKNTTLLREWDIVIPDLPGYGQSRKPPSPDGSHYAHSKRAIGKDCLDLIDVLYPSNPNQSQRIVIIGHDRGARIAYRMARDWKNRVAGICVMDIVPTRVVFERMSLANNNHEETFGTYHWIFLALPPPLPERMISADPGFYMRYTIESWTGSRFRGQSQIQSQSQSNTSHIGGGYELEYGSVKPLEGSLYDSTALESWVGQYTDPEVLQGALEDYRAGASIDLVHDAEPSPSESGAGVECPVLALYSHHLSKRFDVRGVWEGELRLRGGETGLLRVRQVGDEGTGHFVPIEAVEECVDECVGWLGGL